MFIYFDMGNVLLLFDHERGCRQIAEVAGTSTEEVRRVLFDTGLELRYEAGELSTREFYEAFCEQTGTRPDYQAMLRAAGDIFTVNASILPVVAALHAAGYRLGLLSNTCEAHWVFIQQHRFSVTSTMFDVIALSYEVRAMKPDRRIFEAAAEKAGVAPAEIFFTDDIAGHVAGARAAGFDAEQYTTTPELVRQLRKRGLKFNY
ncbi:MAG TPA: HAD family phosphatase [Pirellulales bacterium]